MDPAHRPSYARDLADVHQRLTDLERRPTPPVVTVDAGGAAWNVSNPEWADHLATGFPEFTELRVIDTPVGSQVWRALSDGSVLVWALQVEP